MTYAAIMHITKARTFTQIETAFMDISRAKIRTRKN